MKNKGKADGPTAAVTEMIIADEILDTGWLTDLCNLKPYNGKCSVLALEQLLWWKT